MMISSKTRESRSAKPLKMSMRITRIKSKTSDTINPLRAYTTTGASRGAPTEEGRGDRRKGGDRKDRDRKRGYPDEGDQS
jgi:hypothetical protein